MRFRLDKSSPLLLAVLALLVQVQMACAYACQWPAAPHTASHTASPAHHCCPDMQDDPGKASGQPHHERCGDHAWTLAERANSAEKAKSGDFKPTLDSPLWLASHLPLWPGHAISTAPTGPPEPIHTADASATYLVTQRLRI